MNQTLTPTKRLLLLVIKQGGRCPPPAQNSLFGSRVPSMLRGGKFRSVTGGGRERGRRYSLMEE
jgi:hypothetical protein